MSKIAMDLKWKKWIPVLLWILWMSVIFAYSAKTATQSTVQSNRVGKMLCSVFVSGYRDMPSEAQLKMAESIDFFVRKSAHFLEYTILGVLTVWAMGQSKRLKGRLFWVSLLWCILYAVSDETHQFFVPGRACKASDMVLDSAGALFGIIMILLPVWLKSIRKKETEE
ncbi:MAG: VanZ family protein [Lachnospiraceae bacterium]|nr:VanZ family protein [Lachnospiraceae bacterium]